MTTQTTNTGGDRATQWLLNGFYGTVATVALAGQVTGAVDTLGWPLWGAVPAVAAIELGGIALSAYADSRRKIGERAIAARTLSAAVAGFAVAFNWTSHAGTPVLAWFFAGFSALGYLVYLLHSGARRRDALRAAGNLATIAPVYGLWQWLRHPATTRRARALALADPTLGLHGSLAAVTAQDRAARQTAAIAALLRRKLSEGRDPLAAQIAVTVYDIEEIATRLARSADYDGLAAILAAEVVPTRVAPKAGRTTPHTCPNRAAGGRHTPGCPRCDELAAGARRSRATTRPSTRGRSRSRQTSPKPPVVERPISPAPGGSMVNGLWVARSIKEAAN